METSRETPISDGLRRFTGAWRLESPSARLPDDHDLLVDVDDETTDPVTELTNHVLRVATGAGFDGLGWFRHDPQRGAVMSYSMSRGGRLSVFPVEIAGRRLDFTGDEARARLTLDETGTHLRLSCERREGKRWVPAGTWRAVRGRAGIRQ